MQNAMLAGDFKKALIMQDRLMPLFEVMFVETNPGPVKYAVSRLGICSAEMRLPMVPISDASKKAIDAVMADLGLIGAKAAE
jgi:4-hydroxy-tetrahydrodipicolinate synthase